MMIVRARAITTIECWFAIATIIVLSCCSCNNDAFFVQANSSGFVSGKFSTVTSTSSPSIAFVVPRGGDEADEYDSEYDFDSDDEEEEEEEEEIVPVKTKLSSSTLKASSKAKSRKARTSKKIVNESLSKKKAAPPAVKKASKKKLLYVPYILRALLNPFTVLTMTKGYLASLFNIDYLQQDTSQTLRSALQEKAKKETGSGGAKRTGRARKMKPGQAKTLSDLPQLNT